jgi:hypothetical protein
MMSEAGLLRVVIEFADAFGLFYDMTYFLPAMLIFCPHPAPI